MTAAIFCKWARDANSGTMPWNSLWSLICEETTFERILPSSTTAAAVSSQDVSMPRMRRV
jgi:hypothetical protein